MVCEDGTSQSRPQYASRAREGSIWKTRLEETSSPSTRIVELNPPDIVLPIILRISPVEKSTGS